VLYQLEKDAFPEQLNSRCMSFMNIYNTAKETEEQRLLMAKFTPSFYKNIWQYTALHELGVEYNWKDK
jgi:hypothetical protein